jgi:hypothetical protein
MMQGPMQQGGMMQQRPMGLMGQGLGGMQQPQTPHGMLGVSQPPAPSMHPLIQALLRHLQTSNQGTPTQQMQGPQGAQGGPAGQPYGAYGAFYGGRMPMNTGLQSPGLGAR